MHRRLAYEVAYTTEVSRDNLMAIIRTKIPCNPIELEGEKAPIYAIEIDPKDNCYGAPIILAKYHNKLFDLVYISCKYMKVDKHGKYTYDGRFYKIEDLFEFLNV